jgi:nitrite reductase (NO-forming)
VITADALRRAPRPIDRSADRRVALAGIVASLAFLMAAILSIGLPDAIRHGAWLPLPLALAGGATVAIAAVMPFFTAAFAAAPPADARLRATAVGLVAAGTVGIAIGVPAGLAGLAVGGGVLFISGVALTAIAAVRPLRQALGPSRGLVIQGYVVALVEVGIGAAVATLFLAGWAPVVDDWPRIKPAHAWLNLVGFVSLVIATTLLHFFPTVIGARIVPHRSARTTVAGLGLGAPLVAIGFVVAVDGLARLGAVVVLGGALSLTVYSARAWVTRAAWTTDLGWHRFAMGGLVSSLAWLVIGIAGAAGRVVVLGAGPEAWSADWISGPLVVGWVGLAIVASATHLLPAVGPGDQATHARQRRRLGRLAVGRLVTIDVGVLALSVGLAIAATPLAAMGTVLVAIGLGATAALLLSAAAMGLRRPG